MSQPDDRAGARTSGFTASLPDQGLVSQVSGLVPLIRDHADQSSRERRVSPEVVRALEAAGLFRMLVPRRYGGWRPT